MNTATNCKHISRDILDFVFYHQWSNEVAPVPQRRDVVWSIRRRAVMLHDLACIASLDSRLRQLHHMHEPELINNQECVVYRQDCSFSPEIISYTVSGDGTTTARLEWKYIFAWITRVCWSSHMIFAATLKSRRRSLLGHLDETSPRFLATLAHNRTRNLRRDTFPQAQNCWTP